MERTIEKCKEFEMHPKDFKKLLADREAKKLAESTAKEADAKVTEPKA